METLEKKFGFVYHMKKALFFNKLYLMFKYTLKLTPLVIFIWFLLPNYLLIGLIMGFLALVFWIGGVKMKSLRNINYYAAKQFKLDHRDEINKVFR